jgi:methionyl-tRNA formyltransferase
MKICFFGNHTVGVRTLETLVEQDKVVGVIAHPPDSEDGVRYLSVAEFARSQQIPTIRRKGRDPEVIEFVRHACPDLVWITDYRYLLPRSVLSLAPLGVVNLHPSLLPKYRGRAPLNWAILHGERELGLTAHFVDEGMDTGDIIEQLRFQLGDDQDVGDALRMLYPLYQEISRRVLTQFRAGHVQRYPQDHEQATVFPRRTPADGLIDWNQSATQIRNFVRALAKPYPGAFSYWQGRKIFIWSTEIYSKNVHFGRAGEVVVHEQQGIVVQTGSGALLLKDIEFADSDTSCTIHRGSILRGGSHE